MKDYYKLLAVSPDATEDQIRKAYRLLALKYHPDRNPGNIEAEEQFKEVAEAYGVLIDPRKRTQYNRARTAGINQQKTREGFSYSQEDIFRDLFQDPRFNQGLQEIFKEFEKAGMRFDQQFFKQIFFGNRGIFFGGVFMWGPFGSFSRTNINTPRDSHTLDKSTAKGQISPSTFLKQLGGNILALFTGNRKALPTPTESITPDDIVYHLTLDHQRARQGTWIKIRTEPEPDKHETLRVNIPPQTMDNTRLRLQNKGRITDMNRGNLYLIVHVENPD